MEVFPTQPTIPYRVRHDDQRIGRQSCGKKIVVPSPSRTILKLAASISQGSEMREKIPSDSQPRNDLLFLVCNNLYQKEKILVELESACGVFQSGDKSLGQQGVIVFVVGHHQHVDASLSFRKSGRI